MGELFALLIICALVAAVLYFLIRYWREYRTGTEYAQKRLSWPTTTVKATGLNSTAESTLQRSMKAPLDRVRTAQPLFGH